MHTNIQTYKHTNIQTYIHTYIPSWELTYPVKRQLWRWYSYSTGGTCGFPGGCTYVNIVAYCLPRFTLVRESLSFTPHAGGSLFQGTRHGLEPCVEASQRADDWWNVKQQRISVSPLLTVARRSQGNCRASKMRIAIPILEAHMDINPLWLKVRKRETRGIWIAIRLNCVLLSNVQNARCVCEKGRAIRRLPWLRNPFPVFSCGVDVVAWQAWSKAFYALGSWISAALAFWVGRINMLGERHGLGKSSQTSWKNFCWGSKCPGVYPCMMRNQVFPLYTCIYIYIHILVPVRGVRWWRQTSYFVAGFGFMKRSAVVRCWGDRVLSLKVKVYINLEDLCGGVLHCREVLCRRVVNKPCRGG